MNAKLCKLLRKNAKLSIGNTGVQYEVQRHKERLVPTGNLNADGTLQHRVYIPTTVSNAPRTTRGVYLQLKKIYK